MREKESKLSFFRISLGPDDSFRARKESSENDLDSARQRAWGETIDGSDVFLGGSPHSSQKVFAELFP